MYQSVGIRSIAVSFPRIKRTNDYYRDRYPEKVAQAEQETLGRTFSATESTPNSREFDEAMQPYLSDPFRGAVNRYVLDEDESSLTLEKEAVKKALEAGDFDLMDINLMLVVSMFPEQVGVGNASSLVNELGLNCPAWNIESMQSGALVSLQTAYAMVKSGEYRNVLVVVSCTYSQHLDKKNDTFSWIVGDAATAFLVSPLKEAQGIIGTKTINTAITNDAYSYSLMKDKRENLRVRLQTSSKMSQLIRNNSTKFILESCEGAIAQANVSIDEIDFFVCSTPLAWFSKLFIEVMDIDPKLTLDMYPYYGNIGAALPIANLYYAAKLGRIEQGSLVLLFSIGGSSTAAASVMRWGNVALGCAPDAGEITSLLKNTAQNEELAA